MGKNCFKIYTASLLATLGTFIRCKDGKVKTGTVVDAGNFRVFCRVAKDETLNLISCVIFVQDVNNSTVLKYFHKTNDIP